MYDPNRFAEWLNEAFTNSRFKSFAELADAAKLTRSGVGALMNAKKQPLTGKASQPKPDTVIKLATALNRDIDEALLLAGHAPINNLPNELKGIPYNDFNDEDLREIRSFLLFKLSQKREPTETISKQGAEFLENKFRREDAEKAEKQRRKA